MKKNKITNQIDKVLSDAIRFNNTLEIEKANEIPINRPIDYIGNAQDIINKVLQEIKSTKYSP